jgi:hypothetical protein
VGWLVGENGLVWKTETGGITGINKNAATERPDFILNQNYPNPFNSFTTISFLLPQSKFVELEIFDILGRKITVLVNGIKSAGKHKVEFNGNNLSSGIYFYRLKAGNFIETKKLILIK